MTAATLGEQTVLRSAEYLAQAPYVDADRENGQRLAQMCKACHTIGKGGVNMVGPNLYGFFGKPAGSVEKYSYSPALQEADFVLIKSIRRPLPKLATSKSVNEVEELTY